MGNGCQISYWDFLSAGDRNFFSLWVQREYSYINVPVMPTGLDWFPAQCCALLDGFIGPRQYKSMATEMCPPRGSFLGLKKVKLAGNCIAVYKETLVFVDVLCPRKAMLRKKKNQQKTWGKSNKHRLTRKRTLYPIEKRDLPVNLRRKTNWAQIHQQPLFILFSKMVPEKAFSLWFILIKPLTYWFKSTMC